MNSTTIMIICVVILAGAIGLHYFRKRSQEKMFIEMRENSRQIPKQKRNSFLLLMFKESLNPENIKKRNEPPNLAKFSNPKYLEANLLRMSSALKNPEKVTDKTLKRAIKMYDKYVVWEKEQAEAAKQEKEK
jgi:hypothetical protein